MEPVTNPLTCACAKVLAGVGRPVRVNFVNEAADERTGRIFGGLERAEADTGLRICYVGPAISARPGSRVVVEVLVDGDLLLVYTTVIDCPRPGTLRLHWPTEVHTEQRRRHPRSEADVPVHFVLTGSQVVQSGQVENISAGGMAFHTNMPLPPGAEIKVTFGLGSGFFFQGARARVLRSGPSLRSGFRIAIQFTGLSDGDVQRLSTWIQKSITPDRFYPCSYRTRSASCT
jgi:hypothetical protein